MIVIVNKLQSSGHNAIEKGFSPNNFVIKATGAKTINRCDFTLSVR